MTGPEVVQVSIDFEGTVDLDCSEVFPDGVPDPVGFDAYVRVIAEGMGRGVTRFLEDWNLTDCLTVTITAPDGRVHVLDHRGQTVAPVAGVAPPPPLTIAPPGPFHCPDCGGRFAAAFELGRHCQVVHLGTPSAQEPDAGRTAAYINKAHRCGGLP